MPRSRFVRFVVVGGANTALAYAIYAALVYLGVHYSLANLVSLVIGIVVSFKTQGTLVFGNSDNGRFWRFLACWGLIYFFTIAFIGFMLTLGFNEYESFAMAIAPVTILSYLTQRFIVFRSRSPEEPAPQESSPG
ncbi:MAG: GtrA family protein [Bryobacteraceae bacterium]